jgi:hypothetical protein
MDFRKKRQFIMLKLLPSHRSLIPKSFSQRRAMINHDKPSNPPHSAVLLNPQPQPTHQNHATIALHRPDEFAAHKWADITAALLVTVDVAL